MDLKQIQELMRDENIGVSELGMRNIDNFLAQGSANLKKDKLEPGTTGKRIYALTIRFPFDPANPTDGGKGYGIHNKWESPISPESTVIWLKSLMRKNKDLHAFYADRGGMTADEYKIDSDSITEQDWKVFGGYRSILHYSMMVTKSTMSGHGKMGRKFLSHCKYDKDGAIIEKDDAYLIYELETAIAQQRVEEIKKEYESGSKMNKPEKDMLEEIKLVWKGRKMSKPYLAGTIRTLVIPLNDDFEIVKPEDVLKDGLESLERYAGGAKQSIDKLLGYLNKKADKNFNYLEVDINYPECKDVEQDQRALESYQKRTENAVNPVNRAATTIPGFDEAYRDFRDNQDNFNEKKMLKSVFEYSSIDSATLLGLYKSDLADRKEYITQKTLDTYKNFIAQVDSALNEELLDKMLDDELPEGSTSLEQLADSMPDDPDENTPGYGIEGFEVRVDEDEDVTV